MAITDTQPLPRAPIAERTQNEVGETEYTITYPWVVYFRNFRQDLDAAPITVDTVDVATQSASIATTTITTPTVAGYYSFQFYAAVTTAAVTSSSLTVTLAWTDGGVAKSKSFTAMTGNTTTTTSSEDYLIYSDAAAPITYATTYASNGAGEMVYKLFAVVAGVSR